jgi:hypothetical protein
VPDERLLRRACGKADEVIVLAYGGRAVDVWWQKDAATLSRLPKLRVLALAQEDSRALPGWLNATWNSAARSRMGRSGFRLAIPLSVSRCAPSFPSDGLLSHSTPIPGALMPTPGTQAPIPGGWKSITLIL